MAMNPFALHVSLLGGECAIQGRSGGSVEAASATASTVPESRPSRTARRATSYHNQFHTVSSPATDDPPSYAFAAKQAPRRHGTGAPDLLPKYACTVAAEARLLLHLESTNPLNGVSEHDWRDVHVLLRGTLLSVHRSKDGKPGKLLRSYTLQHAEVGLATDAEHAVLVPQTRLAHLIPSAARRRAWQKDPRLFKSVRQHILRLRVETDQLLLADASESRIHSLIYALSAAIDISPAIDERSLPTQCTVPRRRRRPREITPGNLDDPTLLVEQERILRDMYPAFAERALQGRPTTPVADESAPTELAPTPSREDDDLDLAMMREDSTTSATSTSLSTSSIQQHDISSQRPAPSRQTTAATTTTINSTLTADMLYATSSTNFSTTTGKWHPPHLRTQQQIQRYVRRCLPLLLADSPRASDVLVSNGKRVKINWRMQLLEEWELRPPSYKSHGFNHDDSHSSDNHTARSISQSSTSAGQERDVQASSSSMLAGGDSSDDQIAPAEEAGLAALDLTKVNSMGSDVELSPAGMKMKNRTYPGEVVQGIMFCF